MLKHFQKNRTRLLIISENTSHRTELVILLSGYNFYIDYVDNVKEGVSMFRAYRHPIVIVDESSLGEFHQNMMIMFRRYQRQCVFLISAARENEQQVYPYLDYGIYDILELPLKPSYIHHKMIRLVEHYRRMVRLNFYKFLLYTTAVNVPPIIMLFFYFMKQ